MPALHSITRWALTMASFGGLVALAGCGRGGERAEQGGGDMAMAAPESVTVARVLDGIRTPESARLGPDGRYYVSEIGAFNKDGDGDILAIDAGTWQRTVFASGLNDPKGLTFVGDTLFVTDRDRVLRISPTGDVSVLAGSSAFPVTPTFLNDLATGPDGRVYVSDSGAFDSVDGAVYRVDLAGNVETVITSQDSPEIASPNGLNFDGDGSLLILDLKTGKLLRFEDGAVSVVAQGFGGGDGLERAPDGTLYLTDNPGGHVYHVTLDATGTHAQKIADLSTPADLGLDSDRGLLLIPQLGENTVTVLKLP